MSEWHNNLEQLAQELSEAREDRDRLIAETGKANAQFQEEIENQVNNLEIETLLIEMNNKLLTKTGSVTSSKSWEEPIASDDESEEELDDGDFISVLLEWEENGEREIAVDLGRDDSGLYLEVNGHEIPMEKESLQAALLYAIKEELDLV